MLRGVRLLAAACALSAVWFAAPATPAGAQNATPLRVLIDASQATQKIYHVKVTMPAQAGPFTFVYPKWIPGWHGPVGPVADVVSLRVLAGSTPLAWRRDLVDFFAIHTDVPAGTTSLEVDFDVVGAKATTGEMDVPSTANLLLIQWSSFLMYPSGAVADTLPVNATLRLPSGWSFGTALPVRADPAGSVGTSDPDTIAFGQVSLTTLVDSPLNASRYFKAVPLGEDHELDIAADSAAALAFSPEFLAGMKHLVAEGPALYGTKHYRKYHFLLTLTDAIDPNGIEHHESSDNRADEKYLTDPLDFKAFADLMPHEFSHSWNGKYRRPATLLVDDFQKPERTDLLWVYEGLNQYVGEVLTTRARLTNLRDEMESLAISAAQMDVESGRSWRPVRDLADEAPILYNAPGAYNELRRNAGDFYTEGNLIWLDADVTIRRLSNGTRSLDDFLKLWASGGSTTPSVRTYTIDDVVATLNAIAPNDWAGFFRERIATVQARAPLGGIGGGGWRLAYSATASDLFKANETARKAADFRYSLGIVVSTDPSDDGTIKDVVIDAPAYAAGVAPGMKIVAVDGRRWSSDQLHQSVVAAASRATPIELIVSNGDFFKTVQLAWHQGERFPKLERIPGSPDLLTRIYAPRTFTAPADPPQRAP